MPVNRWVDCGVSRQWSIVQQKGDGGYQVMKEP